MNPLIFFFLVIVISRSVNVVGYNTMPHGNLSDFTRIHQRTIKIPNWYSMFKASCLALQKPITRISNLLFSTDFRSQVPSNEPICDFSFLCFNSNCSSGYYF